MSVQMESNGPCTNVAPAYISPGSPALYDLTDDLGEINWYSQLGDLSEQQSHDAGFGLLDAAPAQQDLVNTQLPATTRPRNAVPASAFQAGDAFPCTGATAPAQISDSDNLDARRKLESWERRSSEPNPTTAPSPDSPPSPSAEYSNLRPNGGMAGPTLMQHTEDLESGALDGSGRFNSDRLLGVQRRRALRRGGSTRSSHYENECLTADLSVQLEKALAANAMLEVRNQLLEQFVGLQAKHTAPGGPPPVVHSEAWWLDSVTRQMVEQRLNLSGMLTFTLRGGKPINLTREQVAALSWLEFCKLWQDYMKALQEGLAEVHSYARQQPQQPSSPLPQSQPGKRLARLVYETGILRGCLQTASPNRHSDLMCFLPEGEPRPPYPSTTTWQKVAASLGISDVQRAQLAQLRVMYLRLLGRMTRQRLQLVVSLQAALPIGSGGDTATAGYEAALEGVEAIRGVLRDEHSLLTQYKMIVWGRVFTPIQAAVVTVEAYPWAADLPAIVNCIADDMGEPSCQDLLAGRA